MTARSSQRPLVAREPELAALGALLADEVPVPAVTVLEGDPGIGKTSLWESGVALARERGWRVLRARASGAETGLPFAALVDLFEEVEDDELAELPAPQLRALRVALYRSDPDAAPEPHAIALGVLTALRGLASAHRLLVAVDDTQWLDRASEHALGYAVRRLADEQVVLLLARRRGTRSVLERDFRSGEVQRLEVGPTSLGATRQLLAEHLGLRLPHHVLRRVYDATLGNPLFTIEVGRMLAGRDLHRLDEDVPVPEDVEEVLGTRVADLAAPVGAALLAVSLDPDLRTADVEQLVGPGSVAAAAQDGVVVLDGDRVRASHPLLAVAARRTASPVERERLHRALAGAATDEHRRVLHLALATTGEDDDLAARVADAAEVAAARGATLLAVRLGDHALRLTPSGAVSYVRRLLRLGEYLSLAGERQRLTDLLSPVVADLPPGAPRLEALLLLTNGVIEDNGDILRLLDQALVQAGDDHRLRAPVLARRAINQAVISVADLPEALGWAEQALTSDHVDHQRLALDALSWIGALRGESVEDLCRRYEEVCSDRFFLAMSPTRVLGQQLVWRGEVGAAREVLTSLQSLAEERAEPSSCALVRLHLCEMVLRVGDWDGAERLLDEWGNSTDSELLHWPMYERCRALLAAGRGDPDGARRWAAEAVLRAERTGVCWDRLEALRALGQTALLEKDADRAVTDLGAVWRHNEEEGVLDPGAFPVAPDLVEALLETGAVARARRVLERLAEVASTQDHPWAEVAARRCDALVAMTAEGYDDRAAEALEGATSTYASLDLRFDAARTLLVLGRAQRRARKWGAAQETLQRAAQAFDDLGSPGWARDARSELGRVGARRPASAGRLTEAEQRVARLAADGLSNKEIARQLVVTVNTVEFHLRNAYAKLGLRSRAQLAARLLEDAGPRS